MLSADVCRAGDGLSFDQSWAETSVHLVVVLVPFRFLSNRISLKPNPSLFWVRSKVHFLLCSPLTAQSSHKAGGKGRMILLCAVSCLLSVHLFPSWPATCVSPLLEGLAFTGSPVPLKAIYSAVTCEEFCLLIVISYRNDDTKKPSSLADELVDDFIILFFCHFPKNSHLASHSCVCVCGPLP